MKIFLSWSGEVSRQAAAALREWIPSVVQAVDPFMSEEDIESGAPWSPAIAKELEASQFGIVCLTPQNLNKPWLNFEAGAISKSLEAAAKVCPFLIGLRPADLTNRHPLSQFQACTDERDKVLKLIQSINTALLEAGLPPDRLQTVFDKWWPDLEAKLQPLAAQAREESGKTTEPTGREDALLRLMEEMRESIRQLAAREQPTYTGLPHDLPVTGSSIRHARDELDAAEQTFARFRALHVHLGKKEGLALDHCNLANVYMKHGKLHKAEEMLRRALDLYQQLGSKEGMAYQYVNLGGVYQTLGELDRAEQMFRKALDLYQELGSKRAMANQYVNLSLVCRARGQQAEAEDMFRKSVALSEETDEETDGGSASSQGAQ